VSRKEENKNAYNFYGEKNTKCPSGRPRLLRAQ